MVKTKSVYDPVEESDGERILVMRYWPRGLSRERLELSDYAKNLAPSVELLNEWKKGNITWQEYESRYFKEMTAQAEKIKELKKKAKRKTITLICVERENNPNCHRHLLKRLIESV